MAYRCRIYVMFHKHHTCRLAGFTMVEVIIAIALIGIGITSTVAALTKLNAFASTSRNSTGAYAVVMNQIDRIQAASSVPQDAPNGILVRADATQPALPTNGSQILTKASHPDLLKIQELSGGTIVAETLTTAVAPITISGVITYRITATVAYKFQGRNYSFSMSTVRASDQ